MGNRSEATNYNDGKWHGWNGGECPVHPKTVVYVACRGVVNDGSEAGDFAWGHTDFWPIGDIVAFRVVEEYKEPREVYEALGQYFDTYEIARKSWAAFGKAPKITKFIEVIE